MSAVIEANRSQVDAVISELTRLRDNLEGGIRQSVVDFMGNVRDIAEQGTHKISGRLERSWAVSDTESPQGVNVKLFNDVAYAEEEFDRPGNKESEGTPHDVRPEINDFATAYIEGVVFEAVTLGLRK